jgi:hypothetical protein
MCSGIRIYFVIFYQLYPNNYLHNKLTSIVETNKNVISIVVDGDKELRV